MTWLRIVAATMLALCLAHGSALAADLVQVKRNYEMAKKVVDP